MTAPKIQILPLRRPEPPVNASNGSNSSRSSSDSPPDGEATTKEKKSRTSKPKVRSGCVTCKIRRVKCDETKPECDRCTSTGRKCDGYVLVPRKKRAVTTVDKNPSFIPDIGSDELRAIDFFHHKSAPGLASYFDAEFWTRLVVQMSYVEPTIRHAIVALGSLHEQRETSARKKMLPLMGHSLSREPLGMSMPLGKNHPADENPFAITQYNKAIAHLSQRLRSEASVEVTLLACILFVCVEFLRGDSHPAVNHFKSGMSIAMAAIANQAASGGVPQRIKDQILPFLNRIELLSTLFGNDAPWPYPVALGETVPDHFENMREARDSIVHIANLSLRFIRYMKYRKYDRLVLPDDLSRQTAIIRQLERWDHTLNNMLASDYITSRDLDAAKTLRIHQIICLIWMRRSTMPEECANDLSMSEFETAVNLAESISSIAGTRGQRQDLGSSTFLFDMEIVSPIYFVGIKCRHAQLRRRAINVLAGTWRREGLWDSNMAAAIAQRCMEIEEKNLSTIDGSELPAEEDRIYNVHINSEVGIHPTHHRITLYKKPDGVDGQWTIWDEMITLANSDAKSGTFSTYLPLRDPISSDRPLDEAIYTHTGNHCDLFPETRRDWNTVALLEDREVA